MTKLADGRVSCRKCKYAAVIKPGGSDDPRFILCLNTDADHYHHILNRSHACPEGREREELIAI